MKNRLLASESFQAGEKTYYLDFNRVENASCYIRISRVDRNALGISRRSQVVVFEEDFSFLVSAFASLFQSAAYLGQKDEHVNRPEEMLPEGQTGGIKSWAADARPREKLFDCGAESLSDGEILAILIGSGSRGEDAVALAIRLLAGLREGLPALASARGDTLLAMRGLGPAKVSAILAAVEFGKRLFRQKEAAPPSPDT